ncbi:oxidoreductase NAD-binding domain-containing protein 1 [Cladorrhinum sp. PSN259]|nr:oxidoreductase NAD-binding domain-containing protein 1 [Cladorrhinum sp. PSN259]
MTTKESHIDRTSHEPRESSLHTLTITSINQISPTVRIFTLTSPVGTPIKYLPGQWVDLYYPPFPQDQKPGGFTITSSPFPPSDTIELAIQLPPSSLAPSPPTAYLWQSPSSLLLNTPLKIRTGGSFTYPPPPSVPFRRVIFIAGGMGINPLMSMLDYLHPHIVNAAAQEREGPDGAWLEGTKGSVQVLYGVKEPEGGIQGKVGEVLFLERIARCFDPRGGRALQGGVRLFVTGGDGGGPEKEEENKTVSVSGIDVPIVGRRIGMDDIRAVIGDHHTNKDQTVVYVCGPPKMTDELVEGLTSPEGLGMAAERVFYEKWW